MACNKFIPITEGKKKPPEHVSKKLNFDNKLATEWQSVPVMDTMMKVVCRASNRIFVGLPLCTCLSIISLFFFGEYCVLTSFAGRDSDFVDLNVNFTIDVIKTAFILQMVPPFLKPQVMK